MVICFYCGWRIDEIVNCNEYMVHIANMKNNDKSLVNRFRDASKSGVEHFFLDNLWLAMRCIR